MIIDKIEFYNSNKDCWYHNIIKMWKYLRRDAQSFEKLIKFLNQWFVVHRMHFKLVIASLYLPTDRKMQIIRTSTCPLESIKYYYFPAWTNLNIKWHKKVMTLQVATRKTAHLVQWSFLTLRTWTNETHIAERSTIKSNKKAYY